MMAFVKGGFRNADLKVLNYVRKFLKAITLADIATADGSRIAIQSYNIVEGNGLRLDIKEWPKTPSKDEMPAFFTTLWQSALHKCFINNSSHLPRRITEGKQLGGWLDQDVKKKWDWWSAPNDDRIYIRNSGTWTFYHQRGRRFYYSDEVDTVPMNYALPISVRPVGASFAIEGKVEDFNILPPINHMSEFENDYAWSDIQD